MKPQARPFQADLPLPLLLGQTAKLMSEEDYDGAIACLNGASGLVATDPIASQTLALLLLRADQARNAIGWFEKALSLRPGHVPSMTGLAMACQTEGDFSRALRLYGEALALAPQEAANWYHQGVVQAELGRMPEALVSIDRAIALDGNYGLAFARRARILEALGETGGAVDAAVRCCQLLPGECSSWALIGDLLQKGGHLDQAIAAYDRGLALSPADFPCLCNKAHALKEAKRPAEALECAKAALAIEPGHRGARMISGYAQLDLGNVEKARADFLAVARGGVAHRYAARNTPANFRALMLFSPFGGNTPYEDLIKGADFDADLLVVLPDHSYDDAERLTADVDIVVNLVSEPDNGKDAILAAGRFVDAQAKPVVNPPELILATDRETIAKRLAGIPGTVVPVTRHVSATALRERFDCVNRKPLIVRRAGTHGGEMMELIPDAAALARFMREAGEVPLYLTDYVDYASPDGLFRKYRFIFVGDRILPYHLAIGDGWKVHHASTRMREEEWMRKEEAHFLDRPEAVFGAPALAALEEIRRRVGLDYFGIDCALDGDGNVVIFEVNASMLIHLRNEGFDYKTPHVMRIKAAFERMLEERVKMERDREI